MPKSFKITVSPSLDSERSYAKLRGRTSGLGVQEFWHTIFELNESLPSNKKMTDAEIQRQVCLEFPNAKSGKPSPRDYLVGRMRARYNRGAVLTGRSNPGIPTKPSFRYNADGLPINGNTGRPLTRSQLRERIVRHNEKREEANADKEPKRNRTRKTKTRRTRQAERRTANVKKSRRRKRPSRR